MDSGTPRLELPRSSKGVQPVIPHLPEGLSTGALNFALRQLLDEFMEAKGIDRYVAWYYAPLALQFTKHLAPEVTVYDCMDELSNFKGADSALPGAEAELFRRADVVFTGGHSLYLAKRDRHRNVHEFASSIDVSHFAAGRAASEPADQAAIPHPRIGYYGVIDERLDTELLAGLADLRPDWQFVMVGPVVKIDPRELPQRANIHYLGGKSYDELPAYLNGWDVAMMPFALNDATRFISPTKTLEYLAARKPVVSTAIADVVHPYGTGGLVSIAGCAAEFVGHCETALAGEQGTDWHERVDSVLESTAWDATWERMKALIDRTHTQSSPVRAAAAANV